MVNPFTKFMKPFLTKRTSYHMRTQSLRKAGIYLGERLEDAARRVLQEETGLPHKIRKDGVMYHFWPEYHTVTTYCRAEVEGREVEMNQEHSDYKWINQPTKDLHLYLQEMIKKSNIFK